MDDFDYFDEWVLHHIRVNPHRLFPAFDPRDTTPGGRFQTEAFKDFFSAWKRKFRAEKVTRAEAEAATQALASRGSMFPDEHLAALLAHIRVARIVAAREAEAATLRARARTHAAAAEERARLREVWNQLPDAERDRIRAEVVSKYRQGPPPEKFVQMQCIERLREIRGEGR